MAGKSKKLKIKKLQINLTNRWLYTLIVFFSLIVIGVFVYAVAPNPGHGITQIEQPSGCGANQFLKWTGSSWTCEAVCLSDGTNCPLVEEGLWSQTGSDLYYTDGDVGIFGASSPGLNFGNSWSSTPWAGVQLHVGDKFLDIGDWWAGNEIGVRFYTNDVERMQIDTSGNIGIDGNVYANAFIGDGSGLMNIIVKVTSSNDVCNSGNDGLLRYRSSYCSDDDIRSSSLDVCMRRGASSYGWSNVKTRTWTDTSCDTDGCPPGQDYYECWYQAEPGCYDSMPYGCYWSCFLAGTEILMADGTYKNIEQVKEREWIVSYDIENNLKTISKVAHSLVHEDIEDYVIINGELEVTSNHPMWIVNRQEWAQVHTIKLGDILLDSNGQEIIVISLEDINGINTVYNLEIEGEHNNYFAGDILVHNKAPNGDWVP